MDLLELRHQIDDIDNQLVALFKARMQVAADVAEYKRENGMPVLDASRERALLSKIAELSGEEFEDYTRTLYSTILELSRSYQHKQLQHDSALYREITDALENTPKLFPDRAVVACQGVEGAYSQIAAERLFKLPNIMFFSSWEKVFSAIEACVDLEIVNEVVVGRNKTAALNFFDVKIIDLIYISCRIIMRYLKPLTKILEHFYSRISF